MFSTGQGVCMEQLPPCLLSTHREDGLAEDTIIIFRKQEVFIDFIHVFPISGIAHVLHYFAPYLSQPRHPTMSIRTTWKIKIRLKVGSASPFLCTSWDTERMYLRNSCSSPKLLILLRRWCAGVLVWKKDPLPL